MGKPKCQGVPVSKEKKTETLATYKSPKYEGCSLNLAMVSSFRRRIRPVYQQPTLRGDWGNPMPRSFRASRRCTATAATAVQGKPHLPMIVWTNSATPWATPGKSTRPTVHKCLTFAIFPCPQAQGTLVIFFFIFDQVLELLGPVTVWHLCAFLWALEPPDKVNKRDQWTKHNTRWSSLPFSFLTLLDKPHQRVPESCENNWRPFNDYYW